MDDTTHKVDTTHPEYDRALAWWQRARDVDQGSDQVKAKGTLYLPKLGWRHNAEQRYAAYLTRALFYNATTRTIAGLLGAIFRKDLALQVPPVVGAHLGDVTLGGMPLVSFAMEMCRELLLVGRVGMLVDFHTGDTPTTSRPYVVPYLAEQIINHRETVVKGDAVLSLVVLKEIVSTPDPKNRFRTIATPQYRELALNADGHYEVTLWRKAEADSGRDGFVPDEPIVPLRRGKALDFIPFVFVGPSSLRPGIERPPLLDLVDVNLSHFRSSADLEHGRHFTAMPTPWVSGLKSADVIEMGAETVLTLDDPAAKAGLIEFTGQGLKALSEALEQKEKLMAVLGARLLEGAPSTSETAAAVRLRHSGDEASLKIISRTLSQALTQSLRWWAFWEGLDDRDVSVALNEDFFGLQLPPDEVRVLFEALQAGQISYETWFDRLQRADWIRPTVTIDKERAAIREDAKTGAAADAA